MKSFSFELDKPKNVYRAKAITELCDILRSKQSNSIPSSMRIHPSDRDFRKWEQLEAVKRWFYYDWKRIEPKLRTSIVEGISVFLSLFDDNPDVKRTFCPPVECYDPVANADHRYGKPLPSFTWLVETGKVCALNFPIGMNPGLAKALGVMMKLDFQRAVLNRIPEMEAHRERYFRQVFFICDEYQHFATVGENEPTGDEKFFSLSRQPKCIPSSPRRASVRSSPRLPGEPGALCSRPSAPRYFWRCRMTSPPNGKRAVRKRGPTEGQLQLLRKRARCPCELADQARRFRTSANVTASKSYNTRTDFRFDMKTFTELKNAQSIAIAYDGLNPMPPTFCYLKPYYNDLNKSYFEQLAEGEI